MIIVPNTSITYDGNGNTGGTVPVDTAEYKADSTSTIIVLGNTGDLTKIGFTFAGWNTKADGTGIDRAVGTSFTLDPVSITLYAKWTALPLLVLYDSNGSSSGSIPVDSNIYTTGGLVIVAGNTGVLSKTGFNFVGWNTLADGSGIDRAASSSFTMGSTNVTLYAKWAPPHKVIYDGNGKTGGSVPIDTIHYLENATVTILSNTGSLSKTGFSFIGWNTKQDGSGIDRTPGTTFIIGPEDIILYAKWTTSATYTITYNGYGFTGGTVPVDTNKYAAGMLVTVVHSGTLVREGCYFYDWTTSISPPSVNYKPEETFVMPAHNITLYAQWCSLHYSVSYNGNGNTEGTVPIDTTLHYSGDSVIAASRNGLAKTGFCFSGWNSKADGSGIDVVAGSVFIFQPETSHLYAKWTEGLVSYNGNGNTGGSVPIDTNRYSQGSPITIASYGTLVRTGYSFICWNTKADGTGTDRAVGSTFAMGSANVVLYAKWIELPTYTVTYNGNGSTGGTVPTDTNHYLDGAIVTVTSQGTLTRTGYSFVGWNTKADETGTDRAVGSTFAMGSANVVLYAKWTQLPTYTVTYNGNGFTGGTVPTDTNHYLTGETVAVAWPGSLIWLGNISRTGYRFAGWNTKADGSGIDRAVASTFIMGSANVVLYAKWAYTITYDGNGYTGGTVPMDYDPHLEGSMVTVALPGTLIKSGCSFLGWNTKADGSGIDRTAGSTFLMGSANVVLYAKWAALPTYTVTYNGNGSTGGTVPTDTNHYLTGETVAVAWLGSLTRTGYRFVGWNTKADGSGIDQTLDSFFTIGSANVVLYAKWAPLPTYTVTYNGNGSTGGTVPIDIKRYLEGAIVTVASQGTLVKSGCIFQGWSTDADWSGRLGSEFVMGSVNVLLYAVWEELPTYTVTYNGNGNTSGVAPIDLNKYESGSQVSVKLPGSLARTGYVFSGWNTRPDGSGTYIGSTDQQSQSEWIYTILPWDQSWDQMLYAQWLKTCDLKGTLLYNRKPFHAGIIPTFTVKTKYSSQANPNTLITYCSISYSTLTGEYVINNLPIEEVTINIQFNYNNTAPTFGGNYFTTYILKLHDMTEADLINYDMKMCSSIKIKKPYDGSILGRYSNEPYPVYTSPLVFEWEPVPEAIYYEVHIYKGTRFNPLNYSWAQSISIGTVLTSYSASLTSCQESQIYQMLLYAFNQYNEPLGILYYTGADFLILAIFLKL